MVPLQLSKSFAAALKVPSVSMVKMLDKDFGIGYVRISNFQMTTPGEVDAAIVDLTNQGLRSLIIDVRRNPRWIARSCR